ncbi:MAG: flotillin family protein [Alphaproteobacteria bacterium]|nr:flotillin family protein [Alphaproteobacteria bacterium]
MSFEEILLSGISLLGILGFVVVALTFTVRNLLYIAGPNEVLVFSGPKTADGRNYKFIKGGRRVRVPIIESVSRIDLTNMTVDVAVTNAYSKGGIPLTVQGVANIKVAGHEPLLGNALERFLGKSRKEIIAIGKDTLEGNLRGVLSQLTPEEVNNDKITFAEKLLEEAEHDLSKLGLVLDVLKIQNVSDEKGYLDAIGRKSSAELDRKARIAEAQAHAESVIQESTNRERARLAECQAEIEIARADTDRRVRDAQTRRAALVAKETGEVRALVARANADLKVQDARLEQVRRRLEADVIAPARADMEARQADAKGQAAKIVEDGKATAFVLEEMISTWQSGGANARDIFLMQKLRALMESLVDTIQQVHVDKLTVLPGGEHSRAAQAVQLVEELKAGVGVDLPQLLDKFAASRALPDKSSPKR